MNPPVPEKGSTYLAKNRKNEKVGAGWFVFRRGRIGGRIKPAPFPFEHPSKQAAVAEAVKLAEKYPGNEFVVLGVTDTVREMPDVADEPFLVAAE
jgi:hypothetical protein